MLVELGLVDQRYRAVLEVLDGATVIEVARRYGVSRQSVHAWLRAYANHGLAALADRSSKPQSCPHQMSPVVEANVIELRRAHPAWGPRRIRHQLWLDGVDPVPGRSSVYRCLVRHGLIDPTRRKRRREDYRRWERSRAMELWQMDVVGRFHLADGTELKVVTGIDDHSRFCVCARLVVRATARPVCDALVAAITVHGVPDQILTDNGKVFTARFGQGPGPVLFDRICTNNGIRHVLTAAYAPTTTGKVERFHKTLRREFFSDHDYRHASIVDAQAALDAWVEEYNTARPHQSLGDRPPAERFSMARADNVVIDTVEVAKQPRAMPAGPRPAGVTRWVDQRGHVSLARYRYRVGASFAGELIEAVVQGGLVEIFHHGVLVATHVQRLPPGRDRPRRQPSVAPRARRPAAGPSVIRMADGNGSVSFAGAMYRAGRAWRRRQITVTLVGATVQLSVDGKVVRVHPARHDRAKEHGAFATPNGRPRQPKTA